MKQITARRSYTCDKCKGTIEKGQKYVRKSIAVQSTCWSIDDRPKDEIPSWAWETVRFKTERCVPCIEAQ